MKKLIYCAAALATALFAGSCQQEMLDTTATETTVTYTVALPDAQTKAIGDAATVDQLIYEVWKTEVADERDLTGTKDGKAKATRLYQDQTALVQRNGKTCAVVTFNLVQDQEYTILFWAQKAGTGVYETSNLTDVHYAKGCEPGSSEYFSNQENYAAFYAAEFVSDVDSKSRTVILKRPFAQLNIATKNTVKDYTVAMNTSKVTISDVATHFDVAMNRPTETDVTVPAKFEFKTADVPDDPATITVNGQVYDYVAMNYVFAMGPNVTVDYEINTTLTAKNLDGTNGETTSAQIKHTVLNVPLKENYRTNIVGNLLSSTTEYYIEIDNNWADAGDGTEVEVWDGLYAQEPPKVNGVYQISLASELAWLAKAVNGTLVDPNANVTKSTGYIPARNFSGETFVLTQDIDLSHDVDVEGNRIDYGPALWTPIGVKVGHPFMGTFDGQGFTIKNLNVDMDKIVENQRNIQSDLIVKANDGAGLFGSCKTATVKNVTIKDATVKGHYKAAAVVADANCTYVDNCHVEDATIISTPYNNDDANNAGAIVGYLAGEAAWAKVTDCSVKNSDVTAYRDVAAVVGRTNQKTEVLRNTVTNVEVVADQTPAYKERKVGNAGKVIGYDVTNNCVMEGNVVDDATTAVVKVNTAANLQYQANNAADDVVIVFGSDIQGNATITQKVGVDVVVDGCDKKYDGTIYLEGGNQGGSSPETLTFKNINFKHEYGTIDFISADDAKNVGKRYAHNVTVEYCTFTGNSNGDVVPMRYRQTYNMTVKNCTATRVHSFMWATGGLNGIKISDVESSGKNGVSFGTTANVVVEDSEFNATAAYGYGVRVDASGAYKAQINNTKLTAGAPVIMRKATGAYEMNISADSELTSTEVYQIIVASNDYEAGKTLAAPANNYTLNTNGVEYVVYPDAADLLVASSVETLKTAISAAKDGDTIYLMNGVYDGLFLVGAKNVTLKAVNAGQATIAGRLIVAGSSTSTLTCEDLKFSVSENTNVDYGNTYYDNGTGYIIGIYCGNVTVENCEFSGMTDDFGAISYHSYVAGTTTEALEMLTVTNCKFNGGRAIRARANATVTGCEFKGLLNPCLQVLGLGSDTLESNVVFTNNTSDVVVSGVTIKTSNFPTKNITFNVGGNTNCNYIAYDHKNLNNLYPETYTYTGEVKTMSPEGADALTAALNKGIKDIVLMPGKYEGVFAIKADGTTITGKEGVVVDCINLNGKDNVTLENITFDAAGAAWALNGSGAKVQPANIITGGEGNNPLKGSHNVVITGCKFTGAFVDGGGAVSFTDQSRTSGGSGNITIDKCEFNTTGGYFDIYAYYSGDNKSFVIEGNTLKSQVYNPVYFGQYQSSVPVVVKDNYFANAADITAAVYLQAHSSGSYNVSYQATGNTFAN